MVKHRRDFAVSFVRTRSWDAARLSRKRRVEWRGKEEDGSSSRAVRVWEGTAKLNRRATTE